MAIKNINLKLLVDKEKNRVVYAESDEDFVNIILSYLTLPMGTVIKLATKQSNIGSMDNLYESVGNLDEEHLNTEACRDMLLHPRMENLSEQKCRNLVNRVDVEGHDIRYRCPNWTCCTETYGIISMFKNTKCLCGKRMNKKISLRPHYDKEVFIKGRNRFMIADNLMVTLASITTCLSILRKLGITESKAIEEWNVSLGRDEVLQLLKRSLISKTALTDVFLRKEEETMDTFVPQRLGQLNKTGRDPKKVTLKLLVSKSKNKVLCAEAKEDFLDLLFSFLTIPLGSIIQLLGESSFLGCIDNLYKSIQPLCDVDDAILKNAKELLLQPNIAFHYGIHNQLLLIEEEQRWQVNLMKCTTCLDEFKESCSHGLEKVQVSINNPKNINTVTETGGGYAKGPFTFMVSDNLVVTPFSPVSCMSLVSNLGVPFNELEEKVTSIGEHEALSLLRASITSKQVLTRVFCD